MRKAVFLFTLAVVSPLIAQPLTVGQTEPLHFVTNSISPSTAPMSFIDLGHPAQAGGTVSRATVYWSRACATPAFKVVFLRPNTVFGTYTVVAQRTPATTFAGQNNLTLIPPVTVQAGDLIGIVQTQSLIACGSVQNTQSPEGAGTVLMINGDISTGTVASPALYLPGYSLGAMAFDADPLFVRVLPVAGAVQGLNAFFRTAVQLSNPNVGAINLKLVFHPAGASGSASDPSHSFTLNPGQTVTFPDIVATMGASGLGSLDVLASNAQPPIVTARVYSDGGDAGTSGFTEEGLAPSAALDGAIPAIMLLPSDLTNYRVNVGVRSLDAGATIAIALYGRTGTFLKSVSVSYPPNFFEQKTAEQFTQAAGLLEPNGRIVVQVTAGSAFVYNAVIDNRTSDSAMRMAKPN